MKKSIQSSFEKLEGLRKNPNKSLKEWWKPGNTQTARQSSSAYATFRGELLGPTDTLANSEEKPWLKPLHKQEKAEPKRKTRYFK